MTREQAVGRRMTKQRRAIIAALRASDQHPTAELVYEAVRRELPGISLGTVYRNLQLLVAEGEAQELVLGHGGLRFDGNTSPHSHFFCQSCGRVYDVPSPPLERSADWQRQLPGRLLGQRTDFYGICQHCLEQAKPAEKVPE